ncbi:hypothetical protein BSL78_20059 [Apostichopus japonicus]|uniref:Uncharacterized protein n=1 Tax=Stichopus japonicus TaxID=307972 RepID=A0A2G8K558_STIJA|nr:hypothetical protein BSL78_20059 [Apostichopus japonicus]
MSQSRNRKFQREGIRVRTRDRSNSGQYSHQNQLQKELTKIEDLRLKNVMERFRNSFKKEDESAGSNCEETILEQNKRSRSSFMPYISSADSSDAEDAGREGARALPTNRDSQDKTSDNNESLASDRKKTNTNLFIESPEHMRITFRRTRRPRSVEQLKCLSPAEFDQLVQPRSLHEFCELVATDKHQRRSQQLNIRSKSTRPTSYHHRPAKREGTRRTARAGNVPTYTNTADTGKSHNVQAVNTSTDVTNRVNNSLTVRTPLYTSRSVGTRSGQNSKVKGLFKMAVYGVLSSSSVNDKTLRPQSAMGTINGNMQSWPSRKETASKRNTISSELCEIVGPIVPGGRVLKLLPRHAWDSQ